MQPSTSFENLIQYATIAATTTKEIADSARVPFLGSTAALSLSILKCVEISIQIVVPFFGLTRNSLSDHTKRRLFKWLNKYMRSSVPL
jgi:hypothetical protein